MSKNREDGMDDVVDAYGVDEAEDSDTGAEESVSRLGCQTLGADEAEESGRLSREAGLAPGPERARAVTRLVESSGLYRRELAERIHVPRSDLYLLMKPDFVLPLPVISVRALVKLRDELERDGRLASFTEERYYRAVLQLFGSAAPRKRDSTVFTRIREVAELTGISERNVRRHLPPYPKSVDCDGRATAFRPARKLTEQLEAAAARTAPRLAGEDLDQEVGRIVAASSRLAIPVRVTRRRPAKKA